MIIRRSISLCIIPSTATLAAVQNELNRCTLVF